MTRPQKQKTALAVLGVLLTTFSIMVGMNAIPHCGTFQRKAHAKEAHTEIADSAKEVQKRNDKEHNRMYGVIQKTLDRIEKNEARRDKQLDKLDSRTWSIYQEVKK